ncbi:MAG: hypothetical protein U0531_14635 [Dehalococcoidia bacterium]
MDRRSEADVVAEFEGTVTVDIGAGPVALRVIGIGFPVPMEKIVGPRVRPVDARAPAAAADYQMTFARVSRDGRAGFLEARRVADNGYLYSTHNWTTDAEAAEIATWRRAFDLPEWTGLRRRDE